MNDTELLIKIRTALESGGIDSAKTKLEELSQTAVKASAGNAANAVTLDKSRREMESAARAAFALRGAANLSSEGLRGLANQAFNFGEMMGAAIGKLSIGFAAFAAGWKIGSVIRSQFIDPLTEIKSKDLLPNLLQEIKALNEAKLEGLKSQIDGMIKDLDEKLSALEDLNRRETMLRNANNAVKLATAEAMPEGDAREKAIAEAKLAADQENYLATEAGLLNQARILKTAGRAQLEGELLAPLQQKYEEAQSAWAATRESSGPAKAIARINYEAAARNLDVAREKAQPVINDTVAKREADIEVKLKANRDMMEASRIQYEARIKQVEEQSRSREEQARSKADSEIRAAELESLQREFQDTSDPARLTAISDRMLSLRVSGLSENNPHARDLRKSVLTVESRDALERRQQQIAVGFAEGALGREQRDLFARPGDKKEQQDVVRAERDLENAKSGNRETINRLLNLVASMQADQKAIEQRIGNMEKREQVASGLN